MLSFEPGRVPPVREIRQLLLKNDVKIPPELDQEDIAIREALSMLIQHIIHLCQTHITFTDNFNVLVRDGLAQIDTVLESETPGDLRETPRYRSNHPPYVISYLKRWLFTHRSHPYPSKDERQELAAVTGLTCEQISDWLVSSHARDCYHTWTFVDNMQS